MPEQTLPPLPDAKEISNILPEGMGLDILRQSKIVPLRIEDGVLIMGAVSLDSLQKAQMLGAAKFETKKKSGIYYIHFTI